MINLVEGRGSCAPRPGPASTQALGQHCYYYYYYYYYYY